MRSKKFFFALIYLLSAFPVDAAELTLVSVSSDAIQGDSSSSHPWLNGDGQIIVFESDAANLVANDSNEKADIFVRNLKTGVTTRVSLASNGDQADEDCERPVISADGRFVVFESTATNLTSAVSGTYANIFIHDLSTGTTELISAAPDGSEGRGSSRRANISADGRYIAFESRAPNLVSGDTNDTYDIFVRDRVEKITTRVSVSSSGGEGNGISDDRPALSANGRYIAFQSEATNLVDGDNNEALDIFRHDRQTGRTIRISTASDGTEANNDSYSPMISANGRQIVFESRATNLVSNDNNEVYDIFVRDLTTGTTTLVSRNTDGTQADKTCYFSSISGNGRYAAYISRSTTLTTVPTSDTINVFLFDSKTGQTSQLSITPAGATANGLSYRPVLSANGRYFAFYSTANDLVAGDTNNAGDVFMGETGAGSSYRLKGKKKKRKKKWIIRGTIKENSVGVPSKDLQLLRARIRKNGKISRKYTSVGATVTNAIGAFNFPKIKKAGAYRVSTLDGQVKSKKIIIKTRKP